MTAAPRPVDREDPIFLPFWEGTESGELRVQHCQNCGRILWPPRPMCGTCQSTKLNWAPLVPRGVLFTWTEVVHQTVAWIAPPYVVGLVELPEARIRMLGQIHDVAPAPIAIGMPLRARFDPSPSGVTLLNWIPE